MQSETGSTWTEWDWAKEVERQRARAERVEAELVQLRKIVALHQQDGCRVALAATAKALGGDPPRPPASGEIADER